MDTQKFLWTSGIKENDRWIKEFSKIYIILTLILTFNYYKVKMII